VLAYLAAAGDQQDRLGELMRADPAAGQATRPLRGELISQPDRLPRRPRGEAGGGQTGGQPAPPAPLLAPAAPGPAPSAAALALLPPSLRRRAAARIARMGSARVADPAGAAGVLTG